MTAEPLNHYKMNKLYLAGERLPGIKYRHNSKVSIPSETGKSIVGWIVAVDPRGPEPVYTVEREDREADIAVVESAIELLLDPHEQK